MIPLSVLRRIFLIKYNDNLATCFAIDVDNKQYLITAKHLLETIQDQQEIELNYDKQWITTNINLVGHHSIADISVFSVNTLLVSPKLTLEPTIEKCSLGQDMYFLGFPLGMRNDNPVYTELTRGFPLPFVKKAILSCIEQVNDNYRLYLDGINNCGFSGGPVIFQNADDNNKFCVAAVISGYLQERFGVHENENEISSCYVDNNSGIITAYSIEYALSLIKNNPIGCDIT